MKLAIQKASQGVQKGQTPFGACIVKNGKVIACAHNTVWKTSDSTAHAEINAIRLACRKLKTINLSKCVMYSTCEPCPMCFSACHWAGISKIIFGAQIKDAKRFGFNELSVSCATMKSRGHSKVQLQAGCCAKENLNVFRCWSKQKNKKAY